MLEPATCFQYSDAFFFSHLFYIPPLYHLSKVNMCSISFLAYICYNILFLFLIYKLAVELLYYLSFLGGSWGLPSGGSHSGITLAFRSEITPERLGEPYGVLGIKLPDLQGNTLPTVMSFWSL